MGPNRKGRKICILGDTCDSRQIASMAAGCDVLVHESTSAFIPDDTSTDVTDKSKVGVLRSCVRRGHSNPEMAGAFASAIGCKKLVLTHFGAKFDRQTPHKEDEEEEEDDAIVLSGVKRDERISVMFDHRRGTGCSDVVHIDIKRERRIGGVKRELFSGGLTVEEIAERSLSEDVAEQLLKLAGETYDGDVVLARDFLEVAVPMSKGLSASTAAFEIEATEAARNASRSAENYIYMARGGYNYRNAKTIKTKL
jgi:hypothetical protein